MDFFKKIFLISLLLILVLTFPILTFTSIAIPENKYYLSFDKETFKLTEKVPRGVSYRISSYMAYYENNRLSKVFSFIVDEYSNRVLNKVYVFYYDKDNFLDRVEIYVDINGQKVPYGFWDLHRNKYNRITEQNYFRYHEEKPSVPVINIKFVYDKYNYPKQKRYYEKNRLKKYIEYEYNHFKKINKETVFDSQGNVLLETTMEYDYNGMLIKKETINQKENTLSKTFKYYNSQGNIIRVENYFPNYQYKNISYEYDNEKISKRLTEESGMYETQYLDEFDENYNIIKRIKYVGRKLDSSEYYNENGDLYKKKIYKDGDLYKVILFKHDELGRVKEIRDYEENKLIQISKYSVSTYNLLGKVVEVEEFN